LQVRGTGELFNGFIRNPSILPFIIRGRDRGIGKITPKFPLFSEEGVGGVIRTPPILTLTLPGVAGPYSVKRSLWLFNHSLSHSKSFKKWSSLSFFEQSYFPIHPSPPKNFDFLVSLYFNQNTLTFLEDE